jgi:Squalene/phytoene synthase
MTQHAVVQQRSRMAAPLESSSPHPKTSEQHCESSMTLAARITKSASKQAYYTVYFLVDRDRTLEAYRAYAYFRWVDDKLDQQLSDPADRWAFVERQQTLVECGYRRTAWGDLVPEEQMLADLIASDHEDQSGLQSYIRNMMVVMAFDAHRRERLITEQELAQYTCHLATAVTDALHYFIGHEHASSCGEARYFPATAAHITHMLRDTFEDVAAGYFNVPCELLASSEIAANDVTSAPYRDWVRGRVQLARAYFAAGARYLDQLKSLRCRIAGYAYAARFVGILDAIERDGYRLRPGYPEFKRVGYGIRVGGSVCAHAIRGT